MIFNVPTDYIYGLSLIICCGYVVYRGHHPEYAGVIFVSIATFSTLFVDQTFGQTELGLGVGIFVVDLLALAALIGLAIKSDRFWPIWVAAFYLLAFLIHATMLVAPEIPTWAFATAAHFWVYPMLLALAIGAHEYGGSKDGICPQSG